jgi:hypothetical protein
LLACGSLGILWVLKSAELEDAYSVRLQSPIVFQHELRKNHTGNGSDEQRSGEPGALKSGAPIGDEVAK